MAQAPTATNEELQEIARNVRRNIVRMTHAAKSGHPGGSLSSVEILTALYFRIMRHDPKNPSWPDRDRFVLSKGHATPLMYSVLAEAGYVDPEDLLTFRQLGTKLQGHTIIGKPPGVEMTAGALGMGLSFSLGVALAARLDGRDYQVFCLLSDGDSQEGQTWEAVMSAGHYKTANLTAIIDRNHIQNDGYSDYQRYEDAGQSPDKLGGWVMDDNHTANIMNLEPFEDKWRAFGWDTKRIEGHDFDAITAALQEAKANGDKPTAIICETTKGKGVSFMENNPDFHGKAPSDEQLAQALQELGFKE